MPGILAAISLMPLMAMSRSLLETLSRNLPDHHVQHGFRLPKVIYGRGGTGMQLSGGEAREK